MPLLSVIIPCYNSGLYIDEAVDSVLAQTFQDFEIIVINDGSTDDYTNEKLINYCKPKTRVIFTENHGLSSARNRGFKEAKGDYIQFLDADDIISPTKFEEQLDILDRHKDIEICYTNYKIYDIEKQKYLNVPYKKFLGEEPLNDFLFRWERGLSIPIHCALFRKNLWSLKLPFNEKLRAKEDWLMWCELAVKNYKFHFLNSKLAIYRYHENNMTKNAEEMTLALLLSSSYIVQIIPDHFRDAFLKETIIYAKKNLEKFLYPDLVNQIYYLRERFSTKENTLDYKIGNYLLKPHRLLKSILFKKEYF